MIRIFITAEAYRALSGSEPPLEAYVPRGGGYALWLEPHQIARLKHLRASGESYSDTILRLAKEEAA